MKVLICNKFYKPMGGPETIVFDTERELKALGHTPVPFAMQDPANLPSDYDGYFVPGVDYNSSGRSALRLAKEAADIVWSREARRRMEQIIRDVCPDVAHLHNIYHQLSPSILAPLKRAGIPTVMTLHDGKLLCANMLFLKHGKVCEECAGLRFHRAVAGRCVKGSLASSLVCCVEETLHRWTRAYERGIDLFISPSRFLRDRLVEHGRLSAEQIIVLPNYADTSATSPDYTPGSYGLFVGRMEAHKGVLTLLDACEMEPGIPVRLAGQGPLLETCRQAAESRDLRSVEFLGFRTGDDLIRQRRESRFVVLPAEWYENSPMVILEAFSAGKPVIASRIGGIPELVEHEVDGLLFDPGDAEGLAECMRRLMDDPALASEMGRCGRARVEERHSIDGYMRNLLSIYEKLIAERKR